jgi:hypothetical protein
MSSDEPSPVRKILLVEANPTGTVRLRLTKELRRIIDSLKLSTGRDQFELIIETAVTISHIQQALLEHRPEIVHFCGHGAGVNGLVCEDDSGNIQLIPTLAFGDLFKLVKDHVRCVVLNACETEIQANEIVKHIDFVVCMNSPIGDEAALKLAEGFYRAVFAGKGFAECFAWGVNTIQLANIPEARVPIMKTKSNPSKSVSKKAPAASPASTFHRPVTEKPHLLQRIPKTAYLTLLIPVLLLILFMAQGKEDVIGGYYIQEIVPARDLNQPGDGSKHIRCDMVNTELHVSYNYYKRKWQVREIVIWEYYYLPDPNNSDKRYFVAYSKASYLHEEVGWRDGKLLTTGQPTPAQIWVQPRDLPGDPEEVTRINEEVSKETAVVRSRYKESRSAWLSDEARNLIKERPNKEPEKFVRQRSE